MDRDAIRVRVRVRVRVKMESNIEISTSYIRVDFVHQGAFSLMPWIVKCGLF